MAIKSVTIFGSFDTSCLGFLAQSSAFAGACKKVVLEKSGIDCAVNYLGNNNIKGKSGQPVAVKAQIKVPQGGDALMNGTLVAHVINDPMFIEWVRVELIAVSNYPNCLLDISNSLEVAYLQNPPGLIYDPSADDPGMTLVFIGLTEENEPIYELRAAGDIAPAATVATQLINATQQDNLSISFAGAPAASPLIKTLTVTGSFTYSASWTDDGGNPFTATDQEIAVVVKGDDTTDVVITDGGSPVGNPYSIGSGEDTFVGVGLIVRPDLRGFVHGRAHTATGGRRLHSFYVPSGAEEISSFTSTPQIVLASFTNDTGSTIPAGATMFGLRTQYSIIEI